MTKMMKAAEKAIYKQTNKALAGTTKRYKNFMRQAGKAASDHKREQYIAAALGALIVTGVVASKLMTKMNAKKTAAPAPVKKKRKKKAN